MCTIPLFFSKVRKNREQISYELDRLAINNRLLTLENPVIGEVYYNKIWYNFIQNDFLDKVDDKVKIRLYNGSFWIDRKYVIFYNFKDTIEFKNKKKEIEKLKV